ncbi:MAG: NADP oxidoreductase [Chloroflexi bacterium]|nr:NADP oxidoreductase [Chloroflexota bacterium]MDL1944001.1 NADP oxidoreductase [Chloroflexi bacterium CFX2]
MKFGVLGTGMVGLAISSRLAELGHEVMIGTRDTSKSADKLTSRNEAVKAGTFAEAAAFGEILFNATNGAGSLEALKLAGESNLNGKTLVDVSNPLDFSKGMPPALFVMNTDSLGEQIQRAFPNVRVVKTLNMVNANIMVKPREVGGGDHDMFVCGSDADAKEAVMGILREFGWMRITDLGDITAARGMEMYLPLWLRLWGALGTGLFNVKIVR